MNGVDNGNPQGGQWQNVPTQSDIGAVDINVQQSREAQLRQVQGVGSRRAENRGLPNPNQQVEVMVSNHGDYNAQSMSGANITNGQAVDPRGMNAMPVDYNLMPNQNPNVQVNPNGNMAGIVNQYGQVDLSGITMNAQGQYVNAQGQVVNAQGQVINNTQQSGGKKQKRGNSGFNGADVPFGADDNNGGTASKKKSKLPIIVIAVILIAVIVGVVISKKSGGSKEEVQEALQLDYSSSGHSLYERLQGALNAYNSEELDAIIGLDENDSYVAQEWAYVNGVKIRQEFIQRVCDLVSFEYPQIEQKSVTGSVMTDSSGNPITVDSLMNGGEEVTMTVPDWGTIAGDMEHDRAYIRQMYLSAEITPKDYEYNDKMANLLVQYLLDRAQLKTTTVQLALPIVSSNGVLIFDNDIALDNALFATDDFRSMCTKFSQCCVEFTGMKDEYYTTQEEMHNPEYDEWKVVFDEYYNADGGKFVKGVSKWEPWYLRDENNVILKDENGENIVNYYSVKTGDGVDWVQPDETIGMFLEHVRQVETTWKEETGVMFNWIGVWWIQNEYTGRGSTIFRVGDGSIDDPAGIGTPIITKVLCHDGLYHDVRVTMLGYWAEEDAIDYIEKFSSRNRGFTKESTSKLIAYELMIENLEGGTIVFDVSEMALADAYGNITSRTGTMYGFSEVATIKPHDYIIVNDWANSLEIQQKYVIWGKTFNRQFPAVYFKCLAGTGVIPEYSAYEQFVGSGKQSQME